VSAWEMQIKIHLGKLKLNSPLKNIIEKQQKENGLQILPIKLSHVLELDNLPHHHKDPFDRLLIAQAKVEDVFIIGKDEMFSKYMVKLFW
jgi:PIN domain nuclease of toxin-antitoxin system